MSDLRLLDADSNIVGTVMSQIIMCGKSKPKLFDVTAIKYTVLFYYFSTQLYFKTLKLI